MELHNYRTAKNMEGNRPHNVYKNPEGTQSDSVPSQSLGNEAR